MTVFERMQSLVRTYVQQACTEASSGAAMPDSYGSVQTYGSVQNKIKPEVRKKAVEWVALALAAHLVGEKDGEEELGHGDAAKEREAKLFAEVNRTKQNLLQDPEFKAVMDNASLKEIRDMVGDPETYKERKNNFDDTVVEKTRMMYNAVKPDEFAERFYAKLLTPEAQQRKERLQFKNLVNDLETSAQRSITGRIKSFFVGDSREYKNALAAMKNLADGKVQTQEQKEAAKDAIESYIMNRSGVRNHEYGRKRFNAFMKGLGQIMDPVEFRACCQSVTNLRREKGDYENDIKPESYLPKEKRQQYRNATAEFDKARTMAQNDEQRVRDDMDANKLHKGKDGKMIENAVTVRNQQYLDELRKLTPEALKNDEKMRAGMQKRLVDHPSFRPLAAKVIKQNKLGEFLEVPKTYPELMGSGYRETLNKQAKAQQEMDQQKHSELYNKQPEVKKNTGSEIGSG